MRIITNEIVTDFKLYLYEEEKSENTIKKYIHDISVFRKWMKNCELDKSVVLKYKQELCENYSPRSVNSILSSLNALFSFANRPDLKVKTLKIQRRIFSDKEKDLSKSEYEKLLITAKAQKNERLFYLIQTIGCTGLRISELKYITVDSIKSGQAIINCKGKIRQIFLPKQLCEMLKIYVTQQKIEKGPVFITKSGNPLDRSAIWKMMKKLCESANVDKNKVFPHNFRHLFARTFYSLQKDIVRLADILGHSSIETTRIYTIESGEIHKMQLQKLGLLQYNEFIDKSLSS